MIHDDPRVFAATLRNDLPTVDLHGLYAHEALPALDLFLASLLERGQTAGKIIYGIGTGALHRQVIHHLQAYTLIDKIVEDSGFCIIVLK